MNDIGQFQGEVQQDIQSLAQDKDLQSLSRIQLHEVIAYKHYYNSTQIGLLIIRCSQGVLAVQQLVWEIKPDLIIGTGTARGGSLIFYASMPGLLAQSGHGEGTVLGTDIDIHQHNRETIKMHPMARRVQMLQGFSIDSGIIEQVKCTAAGKQRVLVALDSNHAHSHVLAELEAYVPLTSVGSYYVVFNIAVEDMLQAMFSGHPWGVRNNPKTAVHAYLRDHPEFAVDADTHHKLLIIVAPDGYLKRVV